MKKFTTLIFFLAPGALACAQTAGVKSSLDAGKALYEQHCLVCHQADGSGVQNLNPPLIKTSWVLGDKKVLIGVILKGLDEEIEVDGDLYNNIMPPFTYLSDKEVADVLSYVRNSFTNKASMVTEEEVKTFRAQLTD